jgi:hypothetical protein
MTAVDCQRLARIALALVVTTAAPLPAAAQVIPSEPLVFATGRVTIGGDASVTLSCANTAENGFCGDDTGFFNYSDYEHSLVRLARLDVSASLQANRHLSFLADVRSENGGAPRPYALYVRFRPWTKHNVDVQAGRVPPTFGAFTRRTYTSDNILIGYPLGYQYLTSLRPDSLPANADELLRMRGRGWLSSFSLGNTTPDRGVPLATAFLWDTGVQGHAANDWIEGIGSVTLGSIASPAITPQKAGPQFAGRVAVRPLTGLVVGASAARGPFLTRDTLQSGGAIDAPGQFHQNLFGADAEYSRDHYLVRVETIHSRWTLPTLGAPISALSTSVEGRYKLTARLHTAARFDHLGFSSITASTRTATWDAPVTRVEFGGGYLLQRNLQLKISAQHNRRPAGRVQRVDLVAIQLAMWL